MASNLEQWRKEQAKGVEVNLPSGLTVNCRRMGVFDLAFNGKIPRELDALVIRFINGDTKVENLEQINQMAKLIDVTLEQALVGPEGLMVVELPALDKQALFQWCNGGGSNGAETFRDGDEAGAVAPA